MSTLPMTRMQFAQAVQQSLNFDGLCTIPHGVNLDNGSVMWRADFRGETSRDLYIPAPFLRLPGLPSTSEQFRSFLFSERPGNSHLVWEYRRLQMEIDHLRKNEEDTSEEPEAAIKYTPVKKPSTVMEYLQMFWGWNQPVDESYEVDEDSMIVQAMRHLMSESPSRLIDAAKLFYEEKWDCLEMEDDMELGIESRPILPLWEEDFREQIKARERYTLARILCGEIVNYLELMAGAEHYQQNTDSPHSLLTDDNRLVIPAALAPSVAQYFYDTGWLSLFSDISLLDNEDMHPVVRGIMIFHGLAQAIDLKHWNHALEMLLVSTVHHEEIGDRASVKEDMFRTIWVAQQGIHDEANEQLFHPSFRISDADFQMAREVFEELTASHT